MESKQHHRLSPLEIALAFSLFAMILISLIPAFLDPRSFADSAQTKLADKIQYALEEHWQAGLKNNGKGSFPKTLDSIVVKNQPVACNLSHRCFENIFDYPIEVSGWSKIQTNRYVYKNNSSQQTFRYDPQTGHFRAEP